MVYTQRGSVDRLEDIETSQPLFELDLWESDFLASCRRWIELGNNFTLNQHKALDHIHRRLVAAKRRAAS